MDMLYQRYACPFSFIDGMISAGRFSEWVFDFAKRIHDEREEKANWEVWLHKDFERSYDEFRNDIKINKDNQDMSATTIENTVQNSLDILNNFTPSNGGE